MKKPESLNNLDSISNNGEQKMTETNLKIANKQEKESKTSTQNTLSRKEKLQAVRKGNQALLKALELRLSNQNSIRRTIIDS